MPKQTFFNLPAKKRQRLIDFAVGEFATHPYKSASISRIVARAGIAKGSFYQYFENKQELYRYLITLAGEEKARFLQNTPPPHANMDTFAYLRWLFDAGIRFGLSNPKLMVLTQRAINDSPDLLGDFLAQTQNATRQFFEDLVQNGIRNGDLRSDLDIESVVFLLEMLFKELGQYILARVASEGDLDVDRDSASKLFADDSAFRIYDDFMKMLEIGIATGKTGHDYR